MGMDLSGAGGSFSISNTGWEKALQLAGKYGWQPKGVKMPQWVGEPPVSEERSMSGYFYNDHNSVDADDAAAIATALESALPDIPDHEALGNKQTPIPGHPGCYSIPDSTAVNPLEWFSGESKQLIREFIQFCKAGGFLIC